MTTTVSRGRSLTELGKVAEDTELWALILNELTPRETRETPRGMARLSLGAQTFTRLLCPVFDVGARQGAVSHPSPGRAAQDRTLFDISEGLQSPCFQMCSHNTETAEIIQFSTIIFNLKNH